MAFTTEFVMGAGGAEVEEIPVSMSGSGNGTVYPLATVDAGGGAWVMLDGPKTGSTPVSVNIGSMTVRMDAASTRLCGVAYASGTVPISVTTHGFSTVNFTGTVYVTRM